MKWANCIGNSQERAEAAVRHSFFWEENSMKVGVLGSGDVAKTLGSGFLKHGHDVTMGTRAPAKLADWAKQNPKGHIGGFADAAKFGDLVVLAVKGTAAPDALRPANAT